MHVCINYNKFISAILNLKCGNYWLCGSRVVLTHTLVKTHCDKQPSIIVNVPVYIVILQTIDFSHLKTNIPVLNNWSAHCVLKRYIPRRHWTVCYGYVAWKVEVWRNKDSQSCLFHGNWKFVSTF